MAKNLASRDVRLFLTGFLCLFLELAFIRWIPDNVLSLAYYSNIVLIASFLGLGLGSLAARRRDLIGWLAPGLLAAAAAIVLLSHIEVLLPAHDNSEWIWSYYVGNQFSKSRISMGLRPILCLVYAVVAAVFLPLGQKVGSLMKESAPLRAYSLNVAGSLLGIAAFSCLSLAGGTVGSPVGWFLLSSLALLALLRAEGRRLQAPGACCVLLCALAAVSSEGTIWSRYYSIRLKPLQQSEFMVYVNRFKHQAALNFLTRPKVLEKYGLPYALKSPRSLLILGAGSGNDAAVALIHGVPEIQAVEIDPAIAELGERLHPLRPYADPRVRVAVTDARAFLARDPRKYDMIVLGTLDSHALLSGMSTVRLDNFVYTLESLKAIKGHLNDDGLAVLMFSVPISWLGEKVVDLCAAAFSPWRVFAYVGSPTPFNLMLVTGPNLPEALPESWKRVTAQADPDTLPRDDWPYLYLQKRGIPGQYFKTIGLLLSISFATILLLVRPRWDRAELNFFSLGAAFLLLESRSVTALSLMFGSTWTVNTAVFGAVLGMILLANFGAAKLRARRIGPLYLALAYALLAGFVITPASLLRWGAWGRLASVFLAALPMFFSSMIFARHFKASPGADTAYGANLLGAVLGGFLEYSSMALGLNNLYLVAGGFYLLSYLCSR